MSDTINKTKATIRRYQSKDQAVTVATCMKEIVALPHYQKLKIDPARLEFLLQETVHDETHMMVRVLVNEKDEVVGGVCAYCVTQLLSWDKITGDLFLYVMPEYRTLNNVHQLIRAYVKWSKERGATLIQATHTGGYRPELMDALLRRAGFEFMGKLYCYRT